ncbi:MAG: hypothetical protein AAGJ84_09955 [Pseudomonadota bacterium]
MSPEWQDKKVFGLARGAMVRGVIGTLLGIFLHSVLDSYFLAVVRVAEVESLDPSSIPALIFDWTWFAFFLYAGLVLLFLVVFLVPILAVLSFVRLVSFAGAILIVAIITGVFAFGAYSSPSNAWCAENVGAGVRRDVWRSLVFYLPLALGFAIGAQLPLLRSEKPNRAGS